MSFELPKMGFLMWVEIMPSTPHYRLVVQDDGKVVVVDTLTVLPNGRGGTENLTETVTPELVAEALSEALGEFGPGALWNVESVSPGKMIE